MIRRLRTYPALLALIGLSGLCCAPRANAQAIATYQFNNTFAADQSGVPALTALNAGSFMTDTVFGQSRTLYRRSSASNDPVQQSALRLDTSSLALTANNYAVEMVFTFTDTLDPRGISGGYRRIVNSDDPANLLDAGFYVGPGSLLNIYQSAPHDGGAALTEGHYYDVVLSVSPTGEQAYLNGTQAASFNGTPDAILSHYLTFFQDNSTEYGNGNIALLNVFNHSLTSSEVTALNNNGNPFAALQGSATAPEPSALALCALPTLGTLVVRRRKQH